jgi:hypothetical protein
MTMLTDGIKSKSLEDSIKQLDIVELLDRSCEAPAVAPQLVPPSTEAPVEATAE